MFRTRTIKQKDVLIQICICYRFWVETERRWVRLKVSSKGMRIIDKNGIDSVLADIRKRGDKV
jgi:LSU ribosomal protein L28P